MALPRQHILLFLCHAISLWPHHCPCHYRQLFASGGSV